MPTSDSTLQVTILGVGIALLLPAAAGIWKAAHLRTDTFRKWQDRIPIIESGLFEKSKDELLALQADIVQYLNPNDPLSVTVDPSPLVERSHAASEALRMRKLLRGRFRRMREVGRFLLLELALYVTGVTVATAHYTGKISASWAEILGLTLASTSGAAVMLTFCYYVHLESCLNKAEERSSGFA